MDHSVEELHGPEEELMLKRFFLEVDDAPAAGLSTVPFDVHVCGINSSHSF